LPLFAIRSITTLIFLLIYFVKKKKTIVFKISCSPKMFHEIRGKKTIQYLEN